MKGLYKKTSCANCGKHLSKKHCVDSVRLDKHEATIWIHQCPCGARNSIFVFDDDSRNKNWKSSTVAQFLARNESETD